MTRSQGCWRNCWSSRGTGGYRPNSSGAGILSRSHRLVCHQSTISKRDIWYLYSQDAGGRVSGNNLNLDCIAGTRQQLKYLVIRCLPNVLLYTNLSALLTIVTAIIKLIIVMRFEVKKCTIYHNLSTDSPKATWRAQYVFVSHHGGPEYNSIFSALNFASKNEKLIPCHGTERVPPLLWIFRNSTSAWCQVSKPIMTP
jgi:hypothetical protein